MAGYRLACDCGAWMDIPWPETLAELPEPDTEPRLPLHIPKPRRGKRALSPQTGLGSKRCHRTDPKSGLLRLEPQEVEQDYDHVLATSLPLAEGELRHANVDTRARWTSRIFLEIFGVLLAFWGPMLLVSLARPSTDWMQHLPLASIVSCILIMLVASLSPAYALKGLRRPASRHLLEGLTTAFLFSGFVWFYSAWMRFLYPGLEGGFERYLETLGPLLGFALFAVVPGIFEEIAFRGLIQGRISALLGQTQGILVTGLVFALAHGVTLATPILLCLGLYLGWLRCRSQSLIPGIAFHVSYNALVIFLIT